MVLIIDEGVSQLAYYTEAEKLESFETGILIPETVLQERLDVIQTEYLESELHFTLVQNRLDNYTLDYPEYHFDGESMAEIANTIETVRYKFDELRDANIVLETTMIESEKYITPEKARNVHLTQLISFMYGYIDTLSAGKRTIELNLIIVELPKVLNDEFGNLTGIEDIPRLFVEGVGKGVGSITVLGTNILKDVAGGVAEGLGFGIDKDLLLKIGIGAGVILALIIGGLVAFQYSKSYVSEKGKVKARGK